MAKIKAFNGIRYNTDIAGDINTLVSAPYDVISPEDRKYYHDLNKYNFVRLILGEEFDTDNDNENRFTRAGKYFNEWLAKDVMKADVPTIYLYQQKFNRDGKTCVVNGFITAVKICEYAENIILPHENTLSRPKGALTETIERTQANLDCVYGLYSDENNELNKIMDKYFIKVPTINAKDIDNNDHIVWAITNEADVNTITSFMADKQIAIADGHHRYETALKNRNKVRETNTTKEEIESDYVMMTIVNVFEKDLTVLPTHRVINNVGDDIVKSLLEKLTNKFTVTETTKSDIISKMANTNSIRLVFNNKYYLVTKKSDVTIDMNASVYTKELELTILHTLILEELMGIDKEKLAAQTNVTYTRSFEEADTLVNSGNAQMAFICNEIPVKAILDIAAQGEKMPQKATYFYPKLLSGLVVRSLK